MTNLIRKKMFICRLLGDRLDMIIKNISQIHGDNESAIISEIIKGTVFKEVTEIYKNLNCDEVI